ncbi:hypothetical protein P3T76_008384 [Phytophthora citrophthora]|uniref:Bacteriophage T5 Orf172 DNA-binding domain-containing protein n=1 Tax=Phytophthora citrophthora TaxID=4793 RepID=A0AAD9GKF6_9STRA|nr:hypothetical protein P3T76_008384 [Phytophthora citrophthora]
MDSSLSSDEQKYSKWSTLNIVEHGILRDAEKAFTSVKFHKGAPFVPWKDLSGKMHDGIRGLSMVVQIHFHGERLVVDRHGGTHLTTGPITRNSGTTYLRLEYAILDSRMFRFVVLLISDWYKNLYGKLSAEHEKKEKENQEKDKKEKKEKEKKEKEKKEKEDKEKEVKFNGTPVEGVLYETPRAKTAGVYVLNCGATEKYQGLSGGPFFVMKVGRSDDIPNRIVKHNSSRGDFAVGGAKFLFGLEMTIEDTKKAERLLHAKLTQLGFARPLVTQFPARTTETFVFNTKSLPLVHDALCELRCVYPLPVECVTGRLADSKANPSTHLFQSTTQEDHPPAPKRRRINPPLRGFQPVPDLPPPPAPDLPPPATPCNLAPHPP